MAGFFSSLLSDQELFLEWAGVLDWLFDDDRFAKERGWIPTEITKFTKRIKKLPGLKEDHFVVQKSEQLSFPKNHRHHLPTIMMADGNSIGRDVVRHIRNGIAHGKTKIFREIDDPYIEIRDFGKTSAKSAGRQTAYFYIPISYIPKMYKIYAELEKARSNDRSAAKSAVKHRT